ncbi:MAG: (4Fe-4S)-binding protein [Candidatus Aegiribacteria sp. MLS_C]|nr:MAG: (4Fe-4S)-binding protein [Candidatus Aegiribacteria sp. MLS_C]
MKQLVVLSGKGGTGKTSVTACIAGLASKEMTLVLADADVDAANLELLLNPRRRDTYQFTGGFKASIDREACISCGRCMEVCRFGAVVHPDGDPDAYSVDPVSCEGCKSCYYQCPVNAISAERTVAGTWYLSDSHCGPLFHAEMFAGEENSGKLVSELKKAAAGLCGSHDCGLVLVDGPPGIGCPVIAACAGADLALIVTEPGVSAIHDLHRILQTLVHFGIQSSVCINRSDINVSRTEEIEESCRNEGIPVLGRIPYDDRVTMAMCRGKTVLEYDPASPASMAVLGIWKKLREFL